ncbi:auxilin-related protein 2 [Cornus florida]|uniref:auxilin-related protein 2 n=1 Tax=Cornus florida TaxID=4283 RepID=UPI00289F3161|nr:auxilin-related protein 2 [Cornus florida]
MDQFGVLVESIGFKAQGKSTPMADLKGKTNINNGVSRNFGMNLGFDSEPSSTNPSRSTYNSNSGNGSFVDDFDGSFRSNTNVKSQSYDDWDGYDDVFGGPVKNSKPSNRSNGGDGSSIFDFDSMFQGSSNSNPKSSASNVFDDDDDIFGGMSGSKSSASVNYDDVFGSISSPPRESSPIDDLFGNLGGTGFESNGSGRKSGEVEKNATEFDDLIPGFGESSTSKNGANLETIQPQFSSGHSAKSTSNLTDDPFVVLESSSSQSDTSGLLSDLLGEDKGKNSVRSSIDELEDFAMGRGWSNVKERSDVHSGDVKVKTSDAAMKEAIDRVRAVRGKRSGDVGTSKKVSWEKKDATASDDAHKRQLKAEQERLYRKQREKEVKEREKRGSPESDNNFDSFFNMGTHASSSPEPRATVVDPVFDTLFPSRGPELQQTSSGTSYGTKKASSMTNTVDDFSFMFGEFTPSSGEFQEVEGESEERRRARLNHHRRTQARMADALAEKNQRDLQTQQEQEERHRIAEIMDDDIKRWAAGKEGNLRALLSSLQYVLWPDCGWQPISLTDLITSGSVKKVYYKATLCVHPDKVQQKGANLQQKYIAEKVFDLLKEAWNKFNAEELR